MSKKLVFIMSDSEAHLRSEVMRIYEKWGFNSSSVKEIEEWNHALVKGSVSLFGDVSIINLELSDKTKLKKFADLISHKDEKEKFKDDWFGPGVIISSIHAQGAKRIENMVKSSGGEIIKKAKPAETKRTLLNRLKLNNETKKFLDSYTGDKYEILISICNQLEKLSEEEQGSLTVDELIVRLPSTPGSVPPWEFINPMFDGDAEKAISLYKRGAEGSHILVTMSLAKSKLQLLYRLKVLQEEGVWDSKKQAEILGERNGPNIWLTANVSKKVSMATAEYLAKLSLETEANLKGYSRAAPDTIFINFISAVCLSIKRNQPLFIK